MDLTECIHSLTDIAQRIKSELNTEVAKMSFVMPGFEEYLEESDHEFINFIQCKAHIRRVQQKTRRETHGPHAKRALKSFIAWMDR